MKFDLNEALEKKYFKTNLVERSASNWRDIRKALDTKKLDEVTELIRNKLKGIDTIGSYLYRRKYRDKWVSLIFKVWPTKESYEIELDPDDFFSSDFNSAQFKKDIKADLLKVKQAVPEINKVGFVNGDARGEILVYINMPYEHFLLPNTQKPVADKQKSVVDTSADDDFYHWDAAKESDYWHEMQEYGYDPESDF